MTSRPGNRRGLAARGPAESPEVEAAERQWQGTQKADQVAASRMPTACGLRVSRKSRLTRATSAPIVIAQILGVPTLSIRGISTVRCLRHVMTEASSTGGRVGHRPGVVARWGRLTPPLHDPGTKVHDPRDEGA